MYIHIICVCVRGNAYTTNLQAYVISMTLVHNSTREQNHMKSLRSSALTNHKSQRTDSNTKGCIHSSLSTSVNYQEMYSTAETHCLPKETQWHNTYQWSWNMVWWWEIPTWCAVTKENKSNCKTVIWGLLFAIITKNRKKERKNERKKERKRKSENANWKKKSVWESQPYHKHCHHELRLFNPYYPVPQETTRAMQPKAVHRAMLGVLCLDVFLWRWELFVCCVHH